MKANVAFTFLCLMLAGCVALPKATTPVVTITAPFDSKQAAQLLERGPNTIRGSALLRQRGGL